MKDIINPLEIELFNDDDFLKIRETLTRMGIANNQTKKLIQSCHILQKRGKYYIVHFKELLAYDGRCVEFTEEDIIRRNNIAKLLQDWKLCKILNSEIHSFTEDNRFRVLGYHESKNWTLIHKYKIGN